ncbi:hypothetical protein PVAND_017432 [Polypedilum vanderplanki]|uniref:C2H2-type domain-containing protein n=1 Tax=Polypedilum vanderplanki TaxID=319348 RepID=A0A9J6BI23_POLVA|nr:hypothetical protein PVAND_017432 [Polypedilum vanderplanki]
MKIAHANIKRIFVCKHCGKKCKLEEYMRRHLKNFHSKVIEKDDYSLADDSEIEKEATYEKIDREIIERVKPPKIGEKKTFCDICRQSFSQSRVYYEHMKVKHNTDDNEYVCNVCDKGFAVFGYLRKHTIRAHGIVIKKADVIVRQMNETKRKGKFEKRKARIIKEENESSNDTIDDMMEFISTKN